MSAPSAKPTPTVLASSACSARPQLNVTHAVIAAAMAPSRCDVLTGSPAGRRSTLAAAALGGLHATPALTAVLPSSRPAFGVQDRVATTDGCGLTFDDGPHPEGTPAVLELLREREVQATFFLVGEQVVRNPGLAREIVAAGHAVGVHCTRHRNLLRLAPWQVQADIAGAKALLEDIVQQAMRLHRPPYGVLSAAGLLAVRRAGLQTVLWTHWGRDWEARATSASVAARVTSGLHPGCILLLHDADHYSAPGSWRATVGALDAVVDAVEGAGLRWASL